jgi:hypothetical protein
LNKKPPPAKPTSSDFDGDWLSTMSAPYEDDGLEKGLLLPGEADAAAKKTADDAFRSRMVGRECDVWG